MWRLALVVSCACACNQVFGIETTSGPDSDSDGVMDGRDNCALVANRGQLDTDGDTVGDACDPCIDGPQSGVDEDGDGIDDACDACTTGSNNDEDGDGVLDGCDVCPGQSDDQLDDDGDGIGNACDRSTAPNQRVVFDGFAPPRPSWNTGFQDWTVTDIGFGPVPPIAGNFIGAHDPLSPIEKQSDWWIETVLHLPPEASVDGNEIMVEAVLPDGGHTGVQCGALHSGGKWVVSMTSRVVALGDEVQLMLRVRPGGLDCVIDGVVVRSSAPPGSATWYAVLQATTRVEFRWVDIVR